MKFNVPSKTLYAVTSGVSKVINSKNALAILNNFLFTLEGNILTVTGSDVENAMTAVVEVSEAHGQGKFCIDARKIVDLLKELPDQGIEFEIDDETLNVTITKADGKYAMVATAGDQFPDYVQETSEEEPVKFVCNADVLIDGIDKTIFAIGTDDFHPQMMGILVDIHPEDITFVATDTRKLVRYIVSNVKPEVEARCIMPLKPATILKNVFSKDDVLKVTMTSKSATFTSDTYTFNCRFIKGRYPDYNRVIPKNNPFAMRVDRVAFLNAVRRVGVFVDAGFGMEKFRITNDSVNIKSSDPNMCTYGNEKLPCEYNGPEIVIGFSAPFLIEICNVLSTDEIIVNLADPSRPGVFCPTENAEGTEIVMLLMPMNVTEF